MFLLVSEDKHAEFMHAFLKNSEDRISRILVHL